MRGRIAFLNPVTRTGLIHGSDRKRYQFPLENWQGSDLPQRNLEVSFTVRDFEAVAIKPFTGREHEQEIIPPPPAPAAPPPVDASTSVVSEAAIEAFRNVQEFSHAPAGENDPFAPLPVEPLSSGEIFPELIQGGAPRPDLGKLPRTQQDTATGPAAWKFYVAGIVAAILLVVIGYIVTRFL